jgi:hypothetical protein
MCCKREKGAKKMCVVREMERWRTRERERERKRERGQKCKRKK